MYLQKSEKYIGGESYGADPDRNLCKGVICFMIVGLKDDVLYIIKCAPETITGELLQQKLVSCMETLQNIKFNEHL